MAPVTTNGRGLRWPVLQGLLPLDPARIPADLIAGLTLAALAIPEVMGYTKIAGTPVVTGLYTILIPIGFLSGVGVQVALGEASGMLGLAGGGHGTIERLIGVVQQLGRTNWPDLAVAAAVIAIIVGARLLSRKIPGALLAVVGAICASWYFDLAGYGVKVLGPVPSGPRWSPARAGTPNWPCSPPVRSSSWSCSSSPAPWPTCRPRSSRPWSSSSGWN